MLFEGLSAVIPSTYQTVSGKSVQRRHCDIGKLSKIAGARPAKQVEQRASRGAGTFSPASASVHVARTCARACHRDGRRRRGDRKGEGER
jgi:hypothetical protein